jgi:hypothetical protein
LALLIVTTARDSSREGGIIVALASARAFAVSPTSRAASRSGPSAGRALFSLAVSRSHEVFTPPSSPNPAEISADDETQRLFSGGRDCRRRRLRNPRNRSAVAPMPGRLPTAIVSDSSNSPVNGGHHANQSPLRRCARGGREARRWATCRPLASPRPSGQLTLARGRRTTTTSRTPAPRLRHRSTRRRSTSHTTSRSTARRHRRSSRARRRRSSSRSRRKRSTPTSAPCPDMPQPA